MDYAKVIALALSALENGIQLLNRLRQAAQQSGEWTAEQDADFKRRRDAILAQDHWKIEP